LGAQVRRLEVGGLGLEAWGWRLEAGSLIAPSLDAAAQFNDLARFVVIRAKRTLSRHGRK
jgi:hypothetical protein